ncbi:MAG: M1 family metallopeptidase [Bacteroidota bacterium]
MKYLLIFPVFILCSISSHAQQYWQQHVDTRLDVRLDDKSHFLHGYEEITYINNSPDTLEYLYMHLWANAYQHDHTAFAEQMAQDKETDFYYAPKKDRGYIDSLQFVVDGQQVEYVNTDNLPDVARLKLTNPILPGHQVKIATPFRVKIPKVFSRLGHTDQAYFISQWFPKPAVYDHLGWHPLPYLNDGEFFSEIGTYDVNITIPKNYIVMATGNCTDDAENKWLDSLSQLALPSDTLYSESTPVSAKETKTIHFHEDNIHDFAWFADKRWIVRKDTVSIAGNTNPITTYAAFLPQDKAIWLKGTDYLKQTVQHYSKWVGPYPYKTIKAVEGDMHAGGGMEYPTVTIIDKTATKSNLQTVIVHEGGHNWFYGILASNERDHAWMDEGINSFYEHKTMKDLKADTTNKTTVTRNSVSINLENVLFYQSTAEHTDQALEQTSSNFTKLNYGGDVYYKTALFMEWLEQYMGEDHFEAGMHEYFQTWKHKHPYPADLQQCLQKHTDKSLDWFFKGALNTNERIDFAIVGARTEANGTVTATVYNRSAITGPVRIDAYSQDSLLASSWSMPFDLLTNVTLPATAATWTELRVFEKIPDTKSANSYYYRHGFHRQGIKISPFFGMNHSRNEKAFLMPAIGYNQYDGFQVGLLLHDLSMPENRFRFALAPMYAFNTNTFTGLGSIAYVWFPHTTFHNIQLQTDVKTFNYDETHYNMKNAIYARFLKVAPSLQFTLKEKEAHSPITRTLLLKAYSITEDHFALADSSSIPTIKQQQKAYGQVVYMHQNNRTFNPFNYSIDVQMNSDFAKVNLEGNLQIDYFKKHKALYVRAFAGKFIAINNDPSVTSRYYLNTTYTGVNNYLYNDAYLGRSDMSGNGMRQIAIQEGGFKVATPLNPIGRTDNWLLAMNLESDIPYGNIPVRLFLDLGTFANAEHQNPSGNKLLYDAGIQVHIFGDLFTAYLPFIVSQDFNDYMKTVYGNKQVEKSIVFTIKIHNFNWLKTPETILHSFTN